MRLLQALRNEAAKLSADLEQSNLFTHMGDRGTFREDVIREFLRPFLPECYGLSSGEVFSADGQQSAQNDVVIFDNVFSTVLFRNKTHQLFPAESVYGSVEVKSDLNSAELERACANSRSLKKLQREATNILDMTPLSRLVLRDDSLSVGNAPPSNPYVTFAFGYRGPSAETTTEHLNSLVTSDASNRLFLPDFIFVANPGYMILRISLDLTNGIRARFVLPGNDFNQYVFYNTGTDTLPLFYVALNVCLSNIRLRSVNFASLWKTLMDEILASARAVQ